MHQIILLSCQRIEVLGCRRVLAVVQFILERNIPLKEILTSFYIIDVKFYRLVILLVLNIVLKTENVTIETDVENILTDIGWYVSFT